MSNFVNFGVYVDLETQGHRRVVQTVSPIGPYGVHVRTSAATSAAAVGKITGPQEVTIFPQDQRGSYVMVEVEGNVGWLDRTLVTIPDWDDEKGTIIEREDNDGNENEGKPTAKRKGRPLTSDGNKPADDSKPDNALSGNETSQEPEQSQS